VTGKPKTRAIRILQKEKKYTNEYNLNDDRPYLSFSDLDIIRSNFKLISFFLPNKFVDEAINYP